MTRIEQSGSNSSTIHLPSDSIFSLSLVNLFSIPDALIRWTKAGINDLNYHAITESIWRQIESDIYLRSKENFFQCQTLYSSLYLKE